MGGMDTERDMRQAASRLGFESNRLYLGDGAKRREGKERNAIRQALRELKRKTRVTHYAG